MYRSVTERRQTLLLAALVVVNLLITVASVGWTLEEIGGPVRGGTPPPVAAAAIPSAPVALTMPPEPIAPGPSGGPAPLPLDGAGQPLMDGSGASDIGVHFQASQPVMNVNPAAVQEAPLETLYWGLHRLQESPPTALSREQADRLLTALRREGAEEERRAAMLEVLSQEQEGMIGGFLSMATAMPPAAEAAMYAGRADAIALLESPLEVADQDSGPDGPDKPRLSVPYYQLLLGVMELDRSSELPMTEEQRLFVAGQVEGALKIVGDQEQLYLSGVHVCKEMLTDEQEAAIQAQGIRIEEYSLKFRGVVPKDLDVIGYVALHAMARRAGVAIADVPAPEIIEGLTAAGVSPGAKPDPGYYFSGILGLEGDPKLRITADQARAIMPYVKGMADSNYRFHMVKEQIGDALSKPQREWILAHLQASPAQRFPSPGEVVQYLRGKSSAG